MRLIEELESCGDWFDALKAHHPLLDDIDRYLDKQESRHVVYPRRGDRLNALKTTPLSGVKAVVIAQDPYPGCDGGQPNAMGLALSVRSGVKVPASLRNMYKELVRTTSFVAPRHGDLTHWGNQGVLLWNVLLTLNAGQPKSHAKSGWFLFTQAIVDLIVKQPREVVFLSLGRDSHLFAPSFEAAGKSVIKTSHPSPLGATKSAKDGSFGAFLGSDCFNRVNQRLISANEPPICWQLPMSY